MVDFDKLRKERRGVREIINLVTNTLLDVHNNKEITNEVIVNRVKTQAELIVKNITEQKQTKKNEQICNNCNYWDKETNKENKIHIS